MSSSTATDYDKQQDEKIKKLEEKVFGGGGGPGEPLPIPPSCGPDPDPNDEHIREGGWGGDMSAPGLWQSVPMKDDPKLWKVVDAAGKNIAHKFESEAEADKYIAYHVCINEGGDANPPTEPIEPPPVVEPPAPGSTDLTPYAIKGKPMQAGQRGPTERHYASGAPDDWTIEKNIVGIPFKNYQFVVFVTMGENPEHDDNISVKFGGHHQGKTGWYDCGISFGEKGKTGSSQSCAGVEPKHPSTKLCVIKGKKYDSVLGVKTGVAGVYYTDENRLEVWIKYGDKPWEKAVEGTKVGGLNPTKGNQEAQLRIDGFNYTGKKDESDMAKIVAAGGPHIHSAIVTEI